MKILLFVLVYSALLISCGSSKKNSGFETNQVPIDTVKNLSYFKNDTVSYLKYIVSQKENYIFKPLDSFLADLDIKILSVDAPSTFSKNENGGILLFATDFNSYLNENEQNKKRAVLISVNWLTTQSMESVKAIYEENRQAGRPPTYWSASAQRYFGRLTVGDISLPYYFYE